MKQNVSVPLCIFSAILFLSIFLNPFIPVKADGVYVAIGAPANVVPDTDFIARVNISNVQGIDAANYHVSFSKTVLRLDNVTAGNITGMTIPVDIWNESPAGSGNYIVLNNIPGLSGASGSGYLAELHFHVVGAIGSSSNINLSNGVLSNIDAKEITATWNSSAVNIVGVLDHITISPARVSVAPSGTQQFTANGYDQYNNAIIGIGFTWSVTNGGGTINSDGLFTAGATRGVFTDTVVAESQGAVIKQGKATVIVGTAINLTLVSGWNLISLPLIPNSASIEDILAGISVDRVATYDGATQEWHLYSPGTPSDLTEMTHRKGYWVKVTNPCTLTIKGTAPQLPYGIPLLVGWNVIGLPLIPEPQSIEDILAGISVDRVATYDGATQKWYLYSPGAPSDLTEMTHGKGYWVKVTNPSTLIVKGN